MSQSSFKNNVINRIIDMNVDNNITSSLSSIQSATTAALSAVSSAFKTNPFLGHQMDVLSNGASSDALANTNNPVKVDKKLFERINKLSEKVLKYCQCDKLKLVNSPPYIIDILPDICQHLNIIQIAYENKMHVLNDIEYFNIFSRNLVDKLNKLVDLFKQAGRRIYDESSDERARLTKYTLILSHMLSELKSMFPKDVYDAQSFRIAKQDAADFWRQTFKEKAIVSWDEFEKKLNNVHKISSKMEAVKLRRTVQLTESNYVSIFEFDIFTRLFQPWNNLLDNWKFLATEHPGYSAFSTYDEIKKRLQKFIHKPGSYLYRLSCTKLGQWAIGYVTADHNILHTIPQSLVQALIDGQKQNLYLYPNGSDVIIDISAAIEITSATRIQISREQYDMYTNIGSSFQLCKICSENNKDRKLEPCGHMICSLCLESWQDHNVTTPSCPFCRCEIKAFEPIIISPFENTVSKKLLNSKRSSSSIDSTEHDLNEISQNFTKFNFNSINSENVIEINTGDKNAENIDCLPVRKLSETSLSGNPTDNPTSSINCNASVSNLIQLYEASNKNNSPKENKNSPLSSHPDDTYLIPSSLISPNQSRINNENSFIDNTIHSFNKNLNESMKNSISDMHLSSLVDISNSTRVITPAQSLQPPIFPPPLPPTSSELNINSNTALTPPSVLVPMPSVPQLPAQFITSNSNIISNSKKKHLIVKLNNDETEQSKNFVQIRIENSNLLDELSTKFGHDKYKVACALLISNNDITIAHDILKKFNKV